MPARMSGDSTVAPRSADGPATRARCGSQSTMRAPMPMSLSTKNMRDSNIFSCIRMRPLHCVAVTIAIDIMSAGNAGHGWSSSFGTCPPRSLLNLLLLVRRDDEIGAVLLAHDAESLEAHAGRAEMLDARLLDAQLRARHRGEPDERRRPRCGRDRSYGSPPRSGVPPWMVSVLVPIPSMLRAQCR